MNTYETIALVASLLGIVAFCGNIIQYRNRKALVQRLRSFAQGTYMDHYMIARACSRIRYSKDRLQLDFCNQEASYISGVADAARNNIIAVAEEHLGMTPKFRHPAFPEKSVFEDEIKLGIPPDLKMFEISRTTEKTAERIEENIKVHE